ncbi:MAG TPA: 6-carboxytetrahydropterin synthase [Dongiaceae bacterium]|nr:6-carboxytetrahydropterin synthase [Dongiaceae bacterium]
MFEITKDFRFEAAHTLQREVNAAGSRRIHGHSYRAQVALRGLPDPATGMVMDMGMLEKAMQVAHDALDHRFLDEINDLGPATLENLSSWIWRHLEAAIPGLSRVTVYRDSSGESCTYFGPRAGAPEPRA